MRLTTGEVLRIGVAVIFIAGAGWTWLSDREVRADGISLTGSYTGRYETRSGYRYGPDRRHLVLSLVTPDGVNRTLTVADASAPDKIPNTGDQVSVIWQPDAPDTLRLSEAVEAPISQATYWLLGLGVVMLVAIGMDVRKRLSTQPGNTW